MKLKHWILDAELREVEVDLFTWANFVQNHHRHVGEDFIGDYRVSTVFLGIDHNWALEGTPLIYETMIFKNGRAYRLVDRYATWVEAEEGHEEALKAFKNELRQHGELAGDEATVRNVPIPARLPGPDDGGPAPGEGIE